MLASRPALIVGVTGHRDPRPSDLDNLRAQVREVFACLRARHPDAPLVLLTALAEGADQLAARVALEMDVPLIAVLPLPADVYRQDFEGPARAAFDELLSAAEEVRTVPFVADNDRSNVDEPERRARQYAMAGAEVVRDSQLLLALWDGEDNGKVGGTADVVRFRREGIPPPYGPDVPMEERLGRGPLCHIRMPRSASTAPAVGGLSEEARGGVEGLLPASRLDGKG